VNPIAIVRAAYGVALVTSPRAMLTISGGRSAADDGAVAVARILGARHLLQALVQRRGAFPRLGALIDAIHAASMFALASASDAYRKPALSDGAIAATLAAWEMPFARG